MPATVHYALERVCKCGPEETRKKSKKSWHFCSQDEYKLSGQIMQIRITGAFSFLAAVNRSFESRQDLLFGSFTRKEQMHYPILFSFPLPPPKEES